MRELWSIPSAALLVYPPARLIIVVLDVFCHGYKTEMTDFSLSSQPTDQSLLPVFKACSSGNQS